MRRSRPAAGLWCAGIRSRSRCSRLRIAANCPWRTDLPGECLMQEASRERRTGTTLRLCPFVPFGDAMFLIDESRSGRLVERGGERTIFGAVGAGERGELVEVILRLLAVALLELPEAIILPGADVVRIVLQRKLVIDLRRLVVAELAIGVADQISDVGDVVALERLQLADRTVVVVIVVDRGVGGAIGSKEFGIVDGGALLLALLGRGVRGR